MTTLVQHKFGETAAIQATVPITVASTTAGNLVVVGACNTGTMTVTGVADDAAGGTSVYTQVSGAQFNGTANDKGDVWWCSSIKNGVTTITITFSASDGSIKDGWAMEVSGLTGPVIDGSAAVVSNQSNVGTVDNGASVTTTATDGFVFGLVTTSNAISANPQAGNEFSAGGDIQGLTGNAACSLISTTAAAHQPKWTDGASTYGAATVAFKAGGTGFPGLLSVPVTLVIV